MFISAKANSSCCLVSVTEDNHTHWTERTEQAPEDSDQQVVAGRSGKEARLRSANKSAVILPFLKKHDISQPVLKESLKLAPRLGEN